MYDVSIINYGINRYWRHPPSIINLECPNYINVISKLILVFCASLFVKLNQEFNIYVSLSMLQRLQLLLKFYLLVLLFLYL